MTTAIDSFTGKYGFLSNFYHAPLVVQGITYPTSEHAFQAGKTADHAKAVMIAGMPTPGEAKREGRRLTLREDWEDRKDNWMEIVLYEKFRQHPDLLAQLRETGDALLIEGNTWHDQIWGSCNCSKHAGIPGDNQLGHLLMKLRSELVHPNDSK